MLCKEEQIQLLLNPLGADRWLERQLKNQEGMEDKTYFDFINVSFEEVLDYALKHGFDEKAVVEDFSGNIKDQTELEDAFWALSKVGDQYEVFRVERGNKFDQHFFSGRRDAVEFIVKYLIRFVWRALTYQYRAKHYPEKTSSELETILSPFDKTLLKR